MARELTYQKVNDYFESLANRHVDIKDFIGSSTEELVNKLSSHNGAASPFLFFYGYTNKLQGNTQRTFNQKTLSFGIAFTGIDMNDFAAQKTAIDSAEIIGLEVLSRIHLDSQSTEVQWLYNNFIKESCYFEPFDGEELEGLYGIDFNFDIKVPEPLVVTPEKWNDGTGICTG